MALTVVVSCAAALLALLALPIQVQLAVERERALRARVQLSWLFGLVRLRLHPREVREERAAEQESPPARRGTRRRRIARRAAGRLFGPRLIARTFEFLRDVLGALRPRDFHLRARVGLDDPADTGQLWALLGPLGLVLAREDVQLEPAFDQACLQFEASAFIRLIPAQLLFLTAAFFLSPPVLRALVAR